MSRRPYVKSGIRLDSQGFQDEDYKFYANTRWFRTKEEADAYKERRAAIQRARRQGLDPRTYDEVEEFKRNEELQKKLTVKEFNELRADRAKLLSIKQLIEDGTPLSQFTMKVIELLEEKK